MGRREYDGRRKFWGLGPPDHASPDKFTQSSVACRLRTAILPQGAPRGQPASAGVWDGRPWHQENDARRHRRRQKRRVSTRKKGESLGQASEFRLKRAPFRKSDKAFQCVNYFSARIKVYQPRGVLFWRARTANATWNADITSQHSYKFLERL